ncbi:MAG: DNA polymerase III subunit delta [Bacteroidales bacterium]|nr:DNA polymerase III subunit delta [Bacteroidales bacterium]
MLPATQIIEDIKKGTIYPVYFLCGEEPYYIDVLSDFIEKNVLSEQERAFNLQIFYGKDSDPLTIIETARRFPMMANRQVVIVKEAQEMNKTDLLTNYVKQPAPTTVLVLNYKHRKLDKRTKFYQAVSKSKTCLYFESKKLYDNQIPDWIIKYASRKNLSLKYDTALLIAEHVGNDLSHIVNELDKLAITLPAGIKQVLPEHIEKYIGFSKDYNNIELQKAIITRDILKANRIVFHFCKNSKDHPIQLTVSYLYFFFSKLLAYHSVKKLPRARIAEILKTREFFLKDYEKAAQRFSYSRVEQIISLLHETDARSKGIGNISATPCDLLKELIFKILH